MDSTDAEILRRDLIDEPNEAQGGSWGPTEEYKLAGPFDMQWSRVEKYNYDPPSKLIKSMTEGIETVKGCVGGLYDLPSGGQFCYVPHISLTYTQSEDFCKDIGMSGIVEAPTAADVARIAFVESGKEILTVPLLLSYDSIWQHA